MHIAQRGKRKRYLFRFHVNHEKEENRDGNKSLHEAGRETTLLPARDTKGGGEETLLKRRRKGIRVVGGLEEIPMK